MGEVGLTSAQCPNKNANEGSDVLINESTSAGCPNKSANEGSDVLINELTSAGCPNKSANEGSDVLINESMGAGCPNKSANEGSKLTIDDSTDSEIDKQKQLLNILEKNPHITQHVMALELNTTDRTIRRMLASLQKTGIVKRKGSKKNGYWLILK